MILISHRGNTNGSYGNCIENSPGLIEETLSNGYDCEVDVYYKDAKYWLGHDRPTWLVSRSFLDRKEIWCHAKDLITFNVLADAGLHVFFNNNDDVALTTRGYFWTFQISSEIKLNNNKSIIVLPERNWKKYMNLGAAGYCSDYVANIRTRTY